MVGQVNVEEFVALARHCVVLDVRSPVEYGHAHFPGAYNLPLFSDDERKVVGTTYKQQNREQAIKTGLDYFGPKMSKMVGRVEEIMAKHTKAGVTQKILIHCWRGGMRSAGVAWLLDLYGFEVYVLSGGYKAFRNWVLQQLELPYPFHVIGGYTGSGKTQLLLALKEKKYPVIDLEGLANHKGSAFGGLGQPPQPGPEMFENELALALHHAAMAGSGQPIWIEDESSRIGNINLQHTLFRNLRQAPIFFLDVPVGLRLEFIMHEYGGYDPKELIASIVRIQKRLGGATTKEAVSHILDGNIKEAFAILLRYYDKFYTFGLEGRAGQLVTVPCSSTNAQDNMKKILGLTTKL